ncbi:M23 family metallopeptidase [Aquipuribacter hungaricus]
MVAERRAVTLGDVRDAQAELDRLRDAETAELQAVQALQADLTQKRTEIEARLAGAQDVLAVAEAEAQRQAALEEARKAAEASRSSTGAAAAGTATEEGPVAAPPGSDGILVTPTPGRQSAYGWRIHPVYGVRKFHRGMDISVGCGTPVIAAADGVVQSAKWDGSYGNIIVVRHGPSPVGDLSTAYAHLSEYAVTSGPVTQGQVIGYVGTTGLSTGCHLHFEVRIDGQDVDPAGFI